MSQPAKFIILSLPRSRSAWLAHWLSYPGKRVGHDISIECKTAKDFVDSYKFGADGCVETGAMIGWRLLKHEIPELKTLVVLRHPHEVLVSLGMKGLASEAVSEEIWSRWHMLQAIKASAGVRAINWTELNDEERRQAIWEWLLEIPFDEDWDARFAHTNIQIDFPARLRQLARNQEQIVRFKAEVISAQQKIGLGSCPVFN